MGFFYQHSTTRASASQPEPFIRTGTCPRECGAAAGPGVETANRRSSRTWTRAGTPCFGTSDLGLIAVVGVLAGRGGGRSSVAHRRRSAARSRTPAAEERASRPLHTYHSVSATSSRALASDPLRDEEARRRARSFAATPTPSGTVAPTRHARRVSRGSARAPGCRTTLAPRAGRRAKIDDVAADRGRGERASASREAARAPRHPRTTDLRAARRLRTTDLFRDRGPRDTGPRRSYGLPPRASRRPRP